MFKVTPEILKKFDEAIVRRQAGSRPLHDPKIAQRKAKEASVPIRRLQELLELDAETGDLRWRETYEVARGVHLRVPGQTGGVSSRGYPTITVDGFVFLQHRVVWALATGSWPEGALDHKDRDRLNNAFSNLRETTNKENHANRSDNTSGTVGVMFEKSRQKWKAFTRVGYKMHNIGRYSTKEEAETAYATYTERLKCLGY